MADDRRQTRRLDNTSISNFQVTVHQDPRSVDNPYLIRLAHRCGLRLRMNNRLVYLCSDCCESACSYREVEPSLRETDVYCGKCNRKLYHLKSIEPALYRDSWNSELVIQWLSMYGVSYLQALLDDRFIQQISQDYQKILARG